MARPKGKLFALVAIFAAIGLVAATGAFSSVEATRSVNVDVANDTDALLELSPNANSDNGDYVSFDGNGALQVDLTDSNLDNASGVNPNATTQFDSVFNITNQGTQDVAVYIGGKSGTNANSLNLYEADTSGTSVPNSAPSTGSFVLSPGETVTIGVEVDTTGGSGSTLGENDDIRAQITINAEATS